MSPQAVRDAFSGYPFGAPCPAAELARAEAALGQRIPAVLRELYLAFDGFRGPTNASFFWPLFAKTPGGFALVEMNRYLRDDDVFPQAFTTGCVFYGDAGVGSQWGLKADLPGKIILWKPVWGARFRSGGDGPAGSVVGRKAIVRRIGLAPQRRRLY
ncbi:MAG: hypothetical protein QM811_23585 [Pirellulales bacterium]